MVGTRGKGDVDHRHQPCRVSPGAASSRHRFEGIRKMNRTFAFLLLLLLTTLGVTPAFAQAKQPNILDHLGRRRRLLEHQRLQPRHDGLQDAEHRSHRARKAACSPTGTDSKAAPPDASAFITGQVGFRTGMLKVGLPGAPEGLQARDVTIAERSRRAATRPASSARTISAIAMSTCRRRTASTSSSARCITSTPRKSRRIRTTSRIRRCGSASQRAA